MSEPERTRPETTPDGHHIVVDGRKWRAQDPHIPEALAGELVKGLMAARRLVRTDPPTARPRVQDAKVALGERGDPWWEPTPEGTRERLAAAMRTLLRQRDEGKTICPPTPRAWPGERRGATSWTRPAPWPRSCTRPAPWRCGRGASAWTRPRRGARSGWRRGRSWPDDWSGGAFPPTARRAQGGGMATQKKSESDTPQVKDLEMYEALRRDGASKEKAARISNAAARDGRSEVGERGGEAGSYEDWTVEELKDRARELGLRGYSSRRKAELIRMLRGH